MLLSFLFERCLGEVKSIHFTWYPTDRVTKYVTHSPSSKIHHQECNRSWPTWPTIILHFETHHIDFIIQISIYIYCQWTWNAHSFQKISYIIIHRYPTRTTKNQRSWPNRPMQIRSNLRTTYINSHLAQRTTANRSESQKLGNLSKHSETIRDIYNILQHICSATVQYASNMFQHAPKWFNWLKPIG